MKTDQQEYLHWRKKEIEKADKLLQKIRNMEIPELFKSETHMTEEEEKKILSKVKYEKSNLIIRKSKGQKCKCGHNKTSHLNTGNYIDDEYHYIRKLQCKNSNCDCKTFRKKTHL